MTIQFELNVFKDLITQFPTWEELQKYLETIIINKRTHDNEILNKRNQIYETIQIEKHESENIDETNIVHYNNHVKIKK